MTTRIDRGSLPRKLLTALLLAIPTAPVVAQAPDPGSYSPGTHRVREIRNRMVAMRDGVRISVDLYLPDSVERAGTLVSITPYDNSSQGSRVNGRWWARRGYAVVIADVRGRFDSEGTADPFAATLKHDGYDLVEWAARQPFSNGRVGMIGASYGGWVQWWTASAAPPSLKAIAPLVAPPDPFENTPYQHGVLVGWAMDWATGLAGRTLQVVDTGAYWGWNKSRAAALKQTPYIDLLTNRGIENAPWFSTWIRDNLSTSPYWQAVSYQGAESCERITVPSINVTGWFDANHPGAPANFRCMTDHGGSADARRPMLVIGPWTHATNARTEDGRDYGADALIDLNGYLARWFDYYLKGIDNGVTNDPRVYLFVMGENRWRRASDWPLTETRWTKYYLSSGGRANTETGNGQLSTTLPARYGADSYRYDPADPTPSAGSENGHITGAADLRSSSRRNDVLVYQTPVLTEQVTVIGPVEATLYATTSARDTDWMVRLVDVHPDGYAALLADGVIRARSRDPAHGGRFTATALSTIVPDSTYQYTIRFWRGVANVFKPGHRIRIEISSSWFPYYLRNLNSGADNVGLVKEEATEIATQRISHGGQYPSHLVLPIIP
ncbi:MAG: CocE/NonD family hydrolase [Gemmatimonadales bacterium]